MPVDWTGIFWGLVFGGIFANRLCVTQTLASSTSAKSEQTSKTTTPTFGEISSTQLSYSSSTGDPYFDTIGPTAYGMFKFLLFCVNNWADFF